jgi:hypothetical protein
LLKENGIYLVTVPTLSVLLQMLWTSIAGSKKAKMGGAPTRAENMVFLRELIEGVELRVVIDRCYPL